MWKHWQMLLVGAIMVLVSSILWQSRYRVEEFFSDGRAHDVPSAFLRVSPELEIEYRRYLRECYQVYGCDEQSFFRRRDAIIVRDWSRVYEYLSHRRNWGDSRLTVPNRENFFRETEGFTPRRLREDYVPVLQYRAGQLVLYPCSQTDRRRFVPSQNIRAGLCK